MSIIEQRFKEYQISTELQQENALKEIMQEIILGALAEAGFFEIALFHGGTSLRILYGLGRFSEDLDFLLKYPSSHFSFQPYEEAIKRYCARYGLSPELQDKSKAESVVKKLFLKDTSMANALDLSINRVHQKKLKIKLEIDINPPAGSQTKTQCLNFPVNFSIDSQDLPSNFASKSHALLCRRYKKGRDWYDFDWYVSKQVTPNFTLLTNAINQVGPWKDMHIQVTPAWYLERLKTEIETIDWTKMRNDVKNFLRAEEQNTLALWRVEFFMHRLERLSRTLD